MKKGEKEVHKAFNFHHSLVHQIKVKYDSAKTQKSKWMVAKTVCGNMKQYRMESSVQKMTGTSIQRIQSKTSQAPFTQEIPRKTIESISARLGESIEVFCVTVE